MDEQKPGQIITPGTPQQTPQQPEQAPQEAPQPVPAATPAPAGGFYLDPNEPAEAQVESPANIEISHEAPTAIEWTASEYIAHQKSAAWYTLLFVATIVGSVLVYLITSGDIIAVTVVVFASIIFGFYAGRQPKEQHYAIYEGGLTIGSKTYVLHDFKSFSISDDEAFSSISFMPMKRFMPIISIYYDPQDEDKIIDVLSAYLPIDEHKQDAIDQFMKKIRF